MEHRDTDMNGVSQHDATERRGPLTGFLHGGSNRSSKLCRGRTVHPAVAEALGEPPTPLEACLR